MPEKTQENIHTVSMHNVQKDRATVVMLASYQEFDPPQVTNSRWAYDRNLDPELLPFQNNMRVSPIADPKLRKQVVLGNDLEYGKCEILFGHKVIQFDPASPMAEQLQNAQKSNTIRITDADGKLVAEIGPGRMAFGQFAGPLFAESTSTTAVLHITAMPL